MMTACRRLQIIDSESKQLWGLHLQDFGQLNRTLTVYHCGKGTKPTGMFFVWHSLNVTRMRLPIITCSFSPRNKAVALLSAVNSRSINSSKEYSGLKRSSSTSAASPRKRICDEERGKAVEYSWQALDSKNIFWTLRFIARTSRVYFTLSLHS